MREWPRPKRWPRHCKRSISISPHIRRFIRALNFTPCNMPTFVRFLAVVEQIVIRGRKFRVSAPSVKRYLPCMAGGTRPKTNRARSLTQLTFQRCMACEASWIWLAEHQLKLIVIVRTLRARRPSSTVIGTRDFSALGHSEFPFGLLFLGVRFNPQRMHRGRCGV